MDPALPGRPRCRWRCRRRRCGSTARRSPQRRRPCSSAMAVGRSRRPRPPPTVRGRSPPPLTDSRWARRACWPRGLVSPISLTASRTCGWMSRRIRPGAGCRGMPRSSSSPSAMPAGSRSGSRSTAAAFPSTSRLNQTGSSCGASASRRRCFRRRRREACGCRRTTCGAGPRRSSAMTSPCRSTSTWRRRRNPCPAGSRSGPTCT